MASEMDFFCFPTQCYGVTSGQVSKRSVSKINAELDGMRGQKWNAERAIIFQTVILQCVHLVTGAKYIQVRINT